MSTMTETLNDEALFIPSDKSSTSTNGTDYTPKVAGEYLGHIVDASTITREFTREGRLHKARIFNYKVRVAPENESKHYVLESNDGSSKNINGKHYVGEILIADGIFRFLEPTSQDSFESNAEGNKKYLMFCQSLGMEISTEERTVNGKTVQVQILPDLKEEHLNGAPVIAVVGRGKDWINDEGKTRKSWRCKFTKRWAEGKRLQTDDLPF